MLDDRKNFLNTMKQLIWAIVLLFSVALQAASDEAELMYELQKTSSTLPGLVFLHGTPGSKKDFKEYLENKDLQKHFNMLSVDRLGFGKSSKQVELSFERQLEPVQKLSEKLLGSKNLTCVGHSYGGPLCLKLMLSFPKTFTRGIVIAGPYNPDRKILRWYNSLADLWVVRWLLPKALRNSNKEMKNLKRELQALKEEIPSFKGKLKIIHGNQDGIVPVEDSRWLFQKMKEDFNVDYLEAESKGHFIIWKDFELIKQEILDFLEV